MKIKKIFGWILCVVTVIAFISGCSNTSKPKEGSREALEEKLVGVWDMTGDGDMYAQFTDDGEMLMFRKDKNLLVSYSYKIVDNETVLATGKSERVAGQTANMTSVKIDSYKLSFTRNGSDSETWYACNEDESLQISKEISLLNPQ